MRRDCPKGGDPLIRVSGANDKVSFSTCPQQAERKGARGRPRLTGLRGLSVSENPRNRWTSGHLLRTHIGGINASDRYRLFHRVAAERLTQFLIQHHFDKRGYTIVHLLLHSGV